MSRVKIIKAKNGIIVNPTHKEIQAIFTNPLTDPHLPFDLLNHSFRYFLVYGINSCCSEMQQDSHMCLMKMVYFIENINASSKNTTKKIAEQIITLIENNKDVFMNIAASKGFVVSNFINYKTKMEIDVNYDYRMIITKVKFIIAKTDIIKINLNHLIANRYKKMKTNKPTIQYKEFINSAKKILIKNKIIDENYIPYDMLDFNKIKNILEHTNTCIVCGDLFYSRKASNICSNNTCKRKKTQYKITIERYLNKNNLTFPLGDEDKQRLLKKLKMQVPDKEILLETLLKEIASTIELYKSIIKQNNWIVSQEGETFYLKRSHDNAEIIINTTDYNITIIKGLEHYNQLISYILPHRPGINKKTNKDEVELILTLKHITKG